MSTKKFLETLEFSEIAGVKVTPVDVYNYARTTVLGYLVDTHADLQPEPLPD